MIITLPGGVPLEYSEIKNLGDAKRLLDNLQTALAAYKPILTLFDIIAQIKKVLDKATDIPTDPTGFITELQKLTIMISKIVRFLPQYSVPIMVRDSLNIMINLLIGVEKYLNILLKLNEKMKDVNDNLYKDDTLKEITIHLANTQAKYQEEMLDYAASFISLYNVVRIIAGIIGIDLPVIDLEASLSEIDNLESVLEVVQNIRTVLQVILTNLGGV